MVRVITTQKIKPDGKFTNACELIIQDCQDIQQAGQDERLVNLASDIIEKLAELEKFYVD